MTNKPHEFFVALESVLLRCWIFGFGLLLLMFGGMMLPIELHKQIHMSWFGVLPHELDLVMYGTLGLTKLCVIVFFFIPWLATRMTNARN